MFGGLQVDNRQINRSTENQFDFHSCENIPIKRLLGQLAMMAYTIYQFNRGRKPGESASVGK